MGLRALGPVGVAAIVATVCLAPSAYGAAFLEEQLPLTLLLSQPAALSNETQASEGVELEGTQALLAVYSRAVVALGSDYGGEPLPEDKTPFTLSAQVPGRGRWVTTYVYRWDPAVPWPTDLAMELTWNPDLTTYDGVKLQSLNVSSPVRLTTEPLEMSLDSVRSEDASNATNNAWSPKLRSGQPAEVPPDGKMLLSFSYGVSMESLQESLQVRHAGNESAVEGTSIKLSECEQPIAWWATDSGGTDYDDEEDWSPSDLDLGQLRYLVTCVEVEFDPPPAANGSFSLVLPAGERYSNVSGPLASDLKLPFSGLRPFELPFLQGEDAANLSFRRLNLLLLHGLSNDTSIDDLAGAISIFKIASDVTIDESSGEGYYSQSDGGYYDYEADSAAGLMPVDYGDGDAALIADSLEGVEVATAGGAMSVNGRRRLLAGEDEEGGMDRVAEVAGDSPGIGASTPKSVGGESDGQQEKQSGEDPLASYRSQSGGERVEFNLALLEPSVAQLSAQLEPGAVYRIEVAASDSVRDAFGQPLRPSSAVFHMSAVPTVFKQPSLDDAGRYPMASGASQSFGGSADFALLDTTAQGDWDGQWQVLTRPGDTDPYNRPPKKLSAWGVPADSDDAIADLLQLMILGMAPAGSSDDSQLSSVYGDPSLSSVYGDPEATVDAAGEGSNGEAELRGFDARKLMNEGVLAKQTCCSPLYNTGSNGPKEGPNPPSYLQGTDLSATFLQLASADDSLSLLTWVTALGGAGEPISGATVQLWNLTATSGSNSGSSAAASIITQADTDANGLATLDLSDTLAAAAASSRVDGGPRAALVVVREGDGSGRRATVLGELNMLASLLSRTAYSYSAAPPLAKAAVLVDHPLARPGEELHAWGYLWQPGPNATLTPPKDLLQEYDVALRVQRAFRGPEGGGGGPGPVYTSVALAMSSSGSEEEPREMVLPLEVDPQLGTFNVTVPVPSDATPSSDSLELVLTPKNAKTADDTTTTTQEDGGVVMASVEVVVADPRPPTVELELDAPEWANPSDPVQFTARLRSYVGGDVSGAELDVRWRVMYQGNTTVGEPDDLIVTNASGEADIVVPPSNVTIDPEGWAPPTLELTVTYIGPTRERLVQVATVPLQESPLLLTMRRSVEAEVPGFEWAVDVSATDLSGSNVTGQPVEVTLARNTTGEIVQTCTVETGTGWSECRLSLPEVGAYKLQACLNYNGTTTCTHTVVGKEETDWRKEPWQEHPAINMITKGDASELTLSLDVPYDGAWLLVAWGNYMGHASVVKQLQRGLQDVPLTPGKECAGGCTLQAVVSVPRQAEAGEGGADGGEEKSAVRLGGGVPTSVAFDPTAPHTSVLGQEVVEAILDLEQPATLVVAKEPPTGGEEVKKQQEEEEQGEEQEVVFEPGETVTLSVDLGELPGGEAAPAKVTFVVVDKSILDLAPAQDANLTSELAPSFPADVEVASSCDRMLPRAAAINEVMQIAAQRLALDPWLVPEYNDLNLWPPTGADEPLEQYLQDHNSYATYAFQSWVVGGGPGPRMARSGPMIAVAMAAPTEADFYDVESTNEMAKISGPSAAAKSSPTARLASEFVATPLFEVKESQVGSIANVSFEAPPKLGAYVVRAFVVTADGRFAQLDKEFTVRKPLSLQPSAPRFARVGDRFEAGALLTLTEGDKEMETEVEVSASASGAVSFADGETGSRTLRLAPSGGDTEVRFNLTAPLLGDGQLLIEARTATGGSSPTEVADSLRVTVPVVGLQEAVFVASSFALGSPNASEAGSWTEGLDLPDAVPGTGTVNLTIGVGQLPAVSALADRAVQTRPEEEEDVTAEWALAALTAPYVLAQYQDAGGSLEAVGGAADYAQTQLGYAPDGLTSNANGLVSAKWLITSASNVQPDIWLNAWSSWLLGRLTALGGSNGAQALQEPWGTWNETAASALITAASDSRDRFDQAYGGPDDIAAVYLALGTDWLDKAEEPQASNSEVKQDLSLDRLASEQVNMTVKGRASLLLALSAAPADVREQYSSTIDAIATGFVDSLRVGGRTAYVAAFPGSAAAAPPLDQAMVLMALQQSGRQPPVLTQKLAAYLAGSTSAGGSGGSAVMPASGGLGDAAVMLALQQYDASRGSTSPNIQVKVAAGTTTLVSESFDSPSDPVVQTSLPWEDLPPGTENLTFTAEGSGEASVAVGLNFVPAGMPEGAMYRGLSVDRVVRAINESTGQPTGPPLAAVPLGSQVRVSVRVTTPDYLGAVRVRVLLPGGLEPVDPNVATDAAAAQQCPLQPLLGSGGSGGAFFWFPLVCPLQMVMPQVVELRYSSMHAGTHESSFLAVAASAGDWQLPPTSASVVSEPEVMGLSAGGALVVCDPKEGGGGEGQECTARPAEEGATSAPPKSCPGGCNGGNGACNTATGVCSCSSMFTGEDCSQLADVETS